MPLRDLIGQRHGRLVVVEQAASCPNGGGRRFVCLCDCDTETVARASDLRAGKKTSCGCARVDLARRIGRESNGGTRKVPSSSRVRQMHAYELQQEGYWPGAIEWARRAWR